MGGVTDDGRQYIGLDAFLRDGINNIWAEQNRQKTVLENMASQLTLATEEIATLRTEVRHLQGTHTPPPKKEPTRDDPTPKGPGLRFGFGSGKGKERGDGPGSPVAWGSEPGDDAPPLPGGPSGSSTTPDGKPKRTREPSATPGAEGGYKSKMPKPKPFDGTRGVAAKQWFELVLAYLEANASSFPTEHLKMLFVLTNLKSGSAGMAWGFPYLKQLNDQGAISHIRDLADLQEKFAEAFTDMAAKKQAERAIKKLRQTKSASEYTSRFRTLAMELDWADEDGLKSMYQDGLKLAVRKELSKAIALAETTNRHGSNRDLVKEATLEQLMTLACKFDNIIYMAEAEGEAEDKWRKRDYVSGKAATMSVPQEEKDRRSKEGICIKCGKGKHRFALCKTGWYYEEKEAKGKTAIIDSSDSEKE